MRRSNVEITSDMCGDIWKPNWHHLKRGSMLEGRRETSGSKGEDAETSSETYGDIWKWLRGWYLRRSKVFHDCRDTRRKLSLAVAMNGSNTEKQKS